MVDTLSRRCFIELAAGASLAACFDELPLAAPCESRVVRAGCPSHNCGGRCLLKLHVEDGVIVRIETDDRATDGIEAPQLRACIRGRAYRRRQYHPDRLLHPLKRTGKRGEGTFQPISWD